jgi:hypothetical protein
MKTLTINKILSLPNEEHFIGLVITINQKLSQKEAIEYFQEKYNDEIGGSGHWMLRPVDDKSISVDYVALGKGDEVRTGAYRTTEDTTRIEIILWINTCPEYSGNDALPIKKEIPIITEDLDTFCRINQNDDWIQFNINPNFVRLSFDIDTASALQDVLITSENVTPESLVNKLEAGDYFTTLDFDGENSYITDVNNNHIAKIVKQEIHIDEKKNFSYATL